MKDNQTATAATNQRSPNYPATPLPESINDIRKVFGAEKRTLLNQESLARALGYGGLNGRSRTKIAALRKYGLTDYVGDGAQVSQLAMRILHQPEGSADYVKAVQEAALRPDVFKDFYETHREASEQSIQSELILKRGFSPEGAKAFAKSFRETIVFAKLEKGDYTPDNDADETEDKNAAKNAQPPKVGQPAPNPQKNDMNAVAINPGELPVPIADGLVARVPFPMNEDDFELLIETLKLWKKKLVRKAAPIPPKVKLPSSATWSNGDNDKPVKIVSVMGERDGELYYQSEDGTGIPASQLKF